MSDAFFDGLSLGFVCGLLTAAGLVWRLNSLPPLDAKPGDRTRE